MTRRSRSRFFVLLTLLAIAFVLPAHAAGPVLHTYFDPDPSEDLQLQATTSDGLMPAAIDTKSGVIAAPDPLRAPQSNESAYGGSSTPSSVDATYHIDRNTSRPDRVSYDDPFIPAITPFKRLYAYDMVEESLELGVSDKNLKEISIGGNVKSGDDQFYGDMVVDLSQDAEVRIPTVGPGARVLAAHTTPVTQFKLLHDGADNWFIRGSERKRVRLVLQLAIGREVFGSRFAEVTYATLAHSLTPLSANIKASADHVLDRIGVTRTMPPAMALNSLVAHFRSFAPSDDKPTSTGLQLYQELALSKKGVCRHRAYAFLITAHALGIPTRMVRNEAHAWVEVFDATLWHRIDLGGAAERLDTDQDPSQPMHAPPSDPFSWPQGAESAQELVQRTLSPSGGTTPSRSPGGRDAGAADAGAAVIQPPPSIGPGEGDAGGPKSHEDTRPGSKLSLDVKGAQVRRGDPLAVSGRIESDGQGCRGVRVDFSLRSENGRLFPIQSLSAAEDGRFEGAIVVPPLIEVGEYELVVSTPGDARCGAGQSE